MGTERERVAGFGGYFHGDNGAALGAWHQTGWTGLIADIIRRRHGQVRSASEIIRIIEQENRPWLRCDGTPWGSAGPAPSG